MNAAGSEVVNLIRRACDGDSDALGELLDAHRPYLKILAQRYLDPKMANFQESEGEEFKERFIREARAAATLRSPNICLVYDVSEVDGICFITMAYIEGQPLTERIGSRGFTPAAKHHEGLQDSDRDAATLVYKLAWPSTRLIRKESFIW